MGTEGAMSKDRCSVEGKGHRMTVAIEVEGGVECTNDFIRKLGVERKA